MPRLYKPLILMTISTALLSSVFAQSDDPGMGIIPAPVSLKKGQGVFVLSRSTIVKADDMHDKTVRFLQSQLQQQPSLPATGPRDTVLLTGRKADNLPEEGYRLEIATTRITVTGKGAGLFYGVQSLLQLLPGPGIQPKNIPALTIEDHPRFAYRGMMLDASRHFFTVPRIKEVLDLMATYKLNRFHWHLTDDHGWRIRIRSLPRLTDIGAWRVPRKGRFGTNEPPLPGESATDGGYYTQEDIKDIVQYAADRYITIMPEIDIPGHCMAAIAAYPGLSCTKDTGIKVNPGTGFGVWFGKGRFELHIDNTLNPTDEKVYGFLDTVFTEVAALFPYQYVHIGGDECYKGYWEKDTAVQAFIKSHHFDNTEQLQAYFIRRVSAILRSKNKKLAGWDETLRDPATSGVALATCRWTDTALLAAAQQHDIVLTSSANGLYFDYAQSRSDMEPVNHGGNAPMQQLYSYNPAPDSLSPTVRQHILGIQGCLWTEHIGTMPRLQYMIIPRIFALSETAWSGEERKDYPSFLEKRVAHHLAAMETKQYNFRVPEALTPIDSTLTGPRFTFDLHPPLPGARIYYTLDGHNPSPEDWPYTGPLTIEVPGGKTVDFRTIVVTASGKRSVVSKRLLISASTHKRS